MKPDERLIVFAHARSGSTSLIGALGEHPELELLAEPFNSDHASWWHGHREYRQRVVDEATLNTVLGEIFAAYDGFKTLTSQLPEPLNRSMLLAPDRKLVFLRRRNLLRAVVSNLLGHETKLWHLELAQKPVVEYFSELRPLSVETVGGWLGHEVETVGAYAEMLAGLPPDRCLNLFYEDLFLAPPAERQARLDRVFAFLDLDPLPAGAADRYLDPARARLNTEETYALVPNLREIDDALGSDEHGRLFD